MTDQDEDSLKLKAAIEFGSQHMYSIKNGGLGRTLVINASTQARARIARKRAPTMWEGLYIIVIYTNGLDEDYWDDDAPRCAC